MTPFAADREIAALRAADPAPLIAWLRRPQVPEEHAWSFLWHEVSTLVGRMVGTLQIEQADQRFEGLFAFDPPAITGGAPRRVVGATALGEALAQALSQPLGLEPHRRNALASLADPAALPLLLHHTDAPVDLLAHQPVSLAIDLAPILGDPVRFRAHVERGLQSPSAGRRDLCARLLVFELGGAA
jgi:hypothetical protein